MFLEDLRHSSCVNQHGRCISEIQADVVVNHGPAGYDLGIWTEMKTRACAFSTQQHRLSLPYSLDACTLVVVR